MPPVGIEPTLTKHGTHQRGQEMGDFPQSPPISFLSPLTLKLIKGVRAVEDLCLLKFDLNATERNLESLTDASTNVL